MSFPLHPPPSSSPLHHLKPPTYHGLPKLNHHRLRYQLTCSYPIIKSLFLEYTEFNFGWSSLSSI
ncbi:hypothetical protein Hanom_Chr16g01423201 [Helianthus anomalus]